MNPQVTVSSGGEPPVFKSVAPKLGLVTAFDGMRGIGVMMVLIGHALFRLVESWVTIVDTLPVGQTFLAATNASGPPAWVCAAEDQTVTCFLENAGTATTLAAGASAPLLRIATTVSAGAAAG